MGNFLCLSILWLILNVVARRFSCSIYSPWVGLKAWKWHDCCYLHMQQAYSVYYLVSETFMGMKSRSPGLVRVIGVCNCHKHSRNMFQGMSWISGRVLWSRKWCILWNSEFTWIFTVSISGRYTWTGIVQAVKSLYIPYLKRELPSTIQNGFTFGLSRKFHLDWKAARTSNSCHTAVMVNCAGVYKH